MFVCRNYEMLHRRLCYEAYQELEREVSPIVNTFEIACVVLDSHTFLEQGVSRVDKSQRYSTNPDLRIVQIRVQHDDRVRENVNGVLRLNFLCHS